MLGYLVGFLAVGLTDACLFGYMCGDKWDGLRVTWDLNPFNSAAFESMPRTAQEAVYTGFSRDASCSDSKPFLGNRYVKDGDKAVMLLYDTNGYIAGIQVGIPKNLPSNYPSARLQPPWVDDGDQYILTAYFVDPSLICGTGRSAAQFEAQGTGTGLYIQNGTDPIRDSLLIPADETGMADTLWTRGKCFKTMGVHYWYNVWRNMNCDDFQPVFLMYNDGKLNSFGWAIGADLESPHFEHPPDAIVQLFIRPVPRCLLGRGRRSTMHIFLTESPRRQNWC